MEAELPSELLDTDIVESKQLGRSSMIRLEPLTEAEASEESLFYLCELSPAGPEADCTELDRVWAAGSDWWGHDADSPDLTAPKPTSLQLQFVPFNI